MSCEEVPRSEKRRRRMSAQDGMELFRQFREYKMLENEVRKLRGKCASRKRKRSGTITISSASSTSSLVSKFSRENVDTKPRHKSSQKRNVRSHSSSINRDATLEKCNHDHTLKNTLRDNGCDENSIVPDIKKELGDDLIDVKTEISSQQISSTQDFIATKIKIEKVESSLNDGKELEVSLCEEKPEMIEKNNQHEANCGASLKNSPDRGKKHEKMIVNSQNRAKRRKILENSLEKGPICAKTHENLLAKEGNSDEILKNFLNKEKKCGESLESPKGKLLERRNMLEGHPDAEEKLTKIRKNSLDAGKKRVKTQQIFSVENREKLLKKSPAKEKLGKSLKNSLGEGNEVERVQNFPLEKHKDKEMSRKSPREAKLVKTLKKSLGKRDKCKKTLREPIEEGKNDKKALEDSRDSKQKREEGLMRTLDKEKLEKGLINSLVEIKKHGKALENCPDQEKRDQCLKNFASAAKAPLKNSTHEEKHGKSPDGETSQNKSSVEMKKVEKSLEKSSHEEKKTETTLQKSQENSPAKEKNMKELSKNCQDEKEKLQETIASVRKNVREEWSKILKNGLYEELKNEHIQEYLIKENHQFLKAQKLNRFLEFSLSEKMIKSDQREISKQTKIASALIAIDKALCTTLNRDDDSEKNSETVKFLVDAGRILADLHYSVAMKRRLDVIGAFDLDDIADVSPIENDLFSDQFSMILKSAKLILKSRENDEKKEMDKKKEGKMDEKLSEENTNKEKMDEKKSEEKNEKQIDAKKSSEKTDEKNSEEQTSTEKNSKEKTNIEKKSEEETENSEDKKKNTEKDSVEKPSVEKKSDDKNNNDEESKEKRKNTEEKTENCEEKMPKGNVTEVKAETEQLFSCYQTFFRELKAMKEELEIVYQKGPKAEKKTVNTPAPDEPFPGIIEAVKRAYRAKGWPEGAIDTMVNARTLSTMKSYERSANFWWDYCKQNPNVDVYDATARQVIQFFVVHEHVIKTHGVLATWRSAMADFASDDLGKDKFVSNYVKGFQVVKTEKK